MDTIIPQRQCTKCKKTLPHTIEYFQQHPKGLNGLKPSCRVCCNEYGRNRYPKKVSDIPEGQKFCHGCDTFYPATREYFHLLRNKKCGLHARCKTCLNGDRREHYKKTSQEDLARQKVYRDTHVEECKQRLLLYRQANPEKYRVYNHNRRAQKESIEGSHTVQDILDQHKRQKGKCYYCRKKVGKKYHVDHVIPLSRGGSDDSSNLVITCPPCNLSKHDKLPHEWTQGGRLM